jgi:PAS domain S-box-containing protein
LWAVVVALAAGYVVTARLGLILALPPEKKATAVWPPSGIALAALLLLGYRIWPGIWLGAFLANLWDYFNPANPFPLTAHLLVSAGIATGSTLQALAGSFLVRRWIGPTNPFDRASHAFTFAGVAMLMCLIAATCGVASLYLGGFALGRAVGFIWWTWWLGDMTGVLTVGALILTWSNRPPFIMESRCLMEAAMFLVLLLALASAIFGIMSPVVTLPPPLAYLTVPFVVWATFRFGLHGAATTIFLLSIIAVLGTSQGTGPFTQPTVQESLLLLQAFMGVIAVTALVMAAVLNERRAAEVAVRSSQEREKERADELEAILRATPTPIWIAHDPQCHRLTGNPASFTLLGLPEGANVSATSPDHDPSKRGFREYRGDTPIPPNELPVQRAARGELVNGAEVKFVFDDGRVRHIYGNAVPLRNLDGSVRGCVAAFTDVTPLKQADEALRRSEAQFRQLADSMAQIVWTARPDGNIDYLNRRWTEFSGLPQTVSNDAWGQILHPDDAQPASQRWAACLQSGTPFEMEIRLMDRRQQSYRWHLIRTVPVHDEAGKVVRWFGTGTDIHEQKRAEQSAHFLAEASAALAVVVDYQSTLQKIANLAVPHFADWSAVDLANDDGTLCRLAVAHQDPDKIALVHQLMHDYPPDPRSAVGAFAVLRTGKPEILSDILDELLVQHTQDERHLHLIRSLGLKSYLCVPLIVSGKTLGVLTFATAESRRRYSQADLAVAVDLANRAAVAIENNQLYQALRDADRRKDEFLATLAHELRNPLAPIRNAVELMRHANGQSAMMEQARSMVERQVNHMVRLVDDLLDISRITIGKLQLRKERVELATVVQSAVEVARPLVEAQGQELTVVLPPEPVHLDADPTRLAQVFANLLDNAAKYTDKRGHIWLTAERHDGEIMVAVRDTGIGITAEHLPYLFEMFSQVTPALERSPGGLGIGLALVKGLVELHGGSVEARSDGIGLGSEFTVRLPIVEAPVQATQKLVDDREKPGYGNKYRMLIADDMPDSVDSLAMMLRMTGHDILTANDGLEAVQTAATFRPDVALLDIGMPRMNGYEVARHIRAQPWGKNTVLVALSGWGQEKDKRRSTEAGFDHHLTKPVEPAALERLLAGLREAR